jgi:hypothetical protein
MGVTQTVDISELRARYQYGNHTETPGVRELTRIEFDSLLVTRYHYYDT